MIEWVSSWASGIVVAIIIATLLELILPEGKNKKYIKIVIGIYILFTIVSPIITTLTGESISIASSFNIDDYIDSQNIETFSINTSTSIEENYIRNIEADIKGKLLEKGYKVIDCKIAIETKEENYGIIRRIALNIEKKKENEEDVKTINEVKEIEINVSNTNNNTEKRKSNILESEINVLKKYISDTYQTDIEFITINDN